MTYTAIACGLLAACALVLASRPVRATAALCAAYLLLAPLGSLGANSVLSRYNSYGQILLLAFMAAVCLAARGRRLLRGCCGAMILSYTLLSVLSVGDDPLLGLKYRLLGLLTFVAGMGVALTVRSTSELRRTLSLLSAACFGVAAVGLVSALSLSRAERLSLFGMNPNSVGIIMAGAACVTFHQAIWGRTSTARAGGWLTTGILLVVLMSTGSRGPCGATALIICMGLAAKARWARPTTVVGGVSVAAAVWLMLARMQTGYQRLAEWNLDTGRETLWSEALAVPRDPWRGAGMHLSTLASGQTGWGNLHSVYVQIYCEAGLIGLALLAAFLVFVLWRALRVARGVALPEKWLACSLLALPLSVGIFESCPLFGLNVASLLGGVGLGLVDALPTYRLSGNVAPARPHATRPRRRPVSYGLALGPHHRLHWWPLSPGWRRTCGPAGASAERLSPTSARLPRNAPPPARHDRGRTAPRAMASRGPVPAPGGRP